MLRLAIESLIVVTTLALSCLLGWTNVDRGRWANVIFLVIFMLGQR